MTEILRARASLSRDKLIALYKAKVLSYLEYRPAAIYHADSWILDAVDRVQVRFLDELGVSEKQAAVQHSLAPLRARRDIAMLGMIFRTVHNDGPLNFKEFFRLNPQLDHSRAHDLQLISWRDGSESRMLAQSALGLVDIWNELPEFVVTAPTVQDFQRALSRMLSRQAELDAVGCWDLLSPRNIFACRDLEPSLLRCDRPSPPHPRG